ncbi:hypothetical protein F511_43926 [Dorcoceras hygrometricum]|uniref:Uncharacterized protein n=1 Tax=Dorcoceras hygrometricum TaxID=472368 RepID=A0A2Z7C1G4_9LAMI|nr:hypothetical protein F511_43926 [Dorcoceras hygrometricum]
MSYGSWLWPWLGPLEPGGPGGGQPAGLHVRDRERAAIFLCLSHELWFVAGAVAWSVGTGWTWGWSSRRGFGHGGRSEEDERWSTSRGGGGACMG